MKATFTTLRTSIDACAKKHLRLLFSRTSIIVSVAFTLLNPPPLLFSQIRSSGKSLNNLVHPVTGQAGKKLDAVFKAYQQLELDLEGIKEVVESTRRLRFKLDNVESPKARTAETAEKCAEVAKKKILQKKIGRIAAQRCVSLANGQRPSS